MRGARSIRLLALMTTACAVTVSLWAQAPAAPTFTDDPLQPGVTPIKVVHLTELRVAINSLRARYGVPAMTWTDATLSPGVTPARAVHLAELRAALDGVYAAASRTPPVYTGSPPSAGVTVITAAHIAELRAGVLAIWNLDAPTITSVEPAIGARSGQRVTIRGTNLKPNVTSVTIGSWSGTAEIAGDAAGFTWITVTPSSPVTGTFDVTVTNPDGGTATRSNGYTYAEAAPRVDSVSPAQGPTTGGTAVTITGAYFQSGATVKLGGTSATGVTVVSATTITATTPAHAAGIVDVVVTNPDAQVGTRTGGFTYGSPATDYLAFGDSLTAGLVVETSAYFELPRLRATTCSDRPRIRIPIPAPCQACWDDR